MDINRISNFFLKEINILNLAFLVPTPNLLLTLKLSLRSKQAGSDLFLTGIWPTSCIFNFVGSKPVILLKSAKLIPEACFMLSQTTCFMYLSSDLKSHTAVENKRQMLLYFTQPQSSSPSHCSPASLCSAVQTRHAQ